MTYELIKDLTTVEILEQAKDLLIRDGWTQGVYAEILDDDGVCHRCAMGALRQFDAQENPRVLVRSEVHDILLDAMNKVDGTYAGVIYDGPYLSVIHWNDDNGRTKEQVLEAFDLAIELAKAREV